VNEPNPDVFVDGEKVTVTWDKGGQRAEIAVKPGTHRVEVKKDGFTVYGEKVEIKDKEREILSAELKKAPVPGQVRPDDTPARVIPPAGRPDRNCWIHSRGSFTNLQGKDWEEKIDQLTHQFVETNRTEEYVELRNKAGRTVHVRLYKSSCEVKFDDGPYKEFYRGHWRPVIKAPVPGQARPDDAAARLIPPAGQRSAIMEEPIWKVENDTLVRTKHAKWKGSTMAFGDASWQDYTFSFEVKKLNDDQPFGASALVRATELNTHYSFNYGGYQNGEWSELVRLDHGQLSRGHNPAERDALCRKIKPMEKGRGYAFAVTVAGDSLTCEVDGIKMFTWKDGSLARGKVGLKAAPGEFVFRKIKVTAPDGTVLWEGLPNLDS